jgi:hypothetical protein
MADATPTVQASTVPCAAEAPMGSEGGADADRPPQAGRYLIEHEIARGGMGVVWRAHDPELHRPVAVKALLARCHGSADVERRFLDEAQVTGQLQHPGVPPVHEIGRASRLAEVLGRRRGPVAANG